MNDAPRIIVTRSKTTGQDCFFDGIGFALLREYARKFPDITAAEQAKPAIEESFHQKCWIDRA